MNSPINYSRKSSHQFDNFTENLLSDLFVEQHENTKKTEPTQQQSQEVASLFAASKEKELTAPIIALFAKLMELKNQKDIAPEAFAIGEEDLRKLAKKHEETDEHMVSVGGRLTQALPIASRANERVDDYLQHHEREAPSGLELGEVIEENRSRIQQKLRISEEEWNSFQGQLKHAIDSVQTLAEITDLPEKTIANIGRVTKSYRMRLTPYYASLIRSGVVNDPILLQSVPTGEMLDNCGIEIPPVAADHSPARLIDQFYPRVVTIKATNMCAMYCTHCLRLAHIGRKDQMYSRKAYGEALEYIRQNSQIRDVLITGGDSFLLPNSMLSWLLEELDAIEHIKTKRLGTRIPVTAPMRVDSELVEILEESNDNKPIRVVTQINTPQEITQASRDAFRNLSKSTFTVLNQAVLLKGINDSRIKMWKLCETIHESYVRPYYLFNCSYRNPQFKHFRVPLEVGRDIVESMYGNIAGDAIPRYIATAGGKIPLHRDNVTGRGDGEYRLKKPWNGEEVSYPDAEQDLYAGKDFAFNRGD